MVASRIVELSGRLAAAGIEGARAEAWLLLAAVTGRARGSLIAGALERLSAAEERRLEAMVRRREMREPIAYILGAKEFWSLPLEVGPAVLIPRPESESLVEAALGRIGGRAAPWRLLDLGTGSGCLLLALLSELPQAIGLGVDLSPDALEIARRNTERLGLTARARFMQGSWGRGLGDRFDLIVSNPPYVGSGELYGLEPEVRAFEPAIALSAGPDGLAAYRSLIPDCARLLEPHGALVLEIGQGQGDAVAGILAAHGFRVAERRPDLAGIERCLVAVRNASGGRNL
jgi:release factor glutamine methyltransferase